MSVRAWLLSDEGSVLVDSISYSVHYDRTIPVYRLGVAEPFDSIIRRGTTEGTLDINVHNMQHWVLEEQRFPHTIHIVDDNRGEELFIEGVVLSSLHRRNGIMSLLFTGGEPERTPYTLKAKKTNRALASRLLSKAY